MGETLEARFASIWGRYPSRNGTKAKRGEAFDFWLKMEESDREAAEAGIDHYRKCAGDYPVDLVRYFRNRRWEDELDPRTTEEGKKQAEHRARIEAYERERAERERNTRPRDPSPTPIGELFSLRLLKGDKHDEGRHDRGATAACGAVGGAARALRSG